MLDVIKRGVERGILKQSGAWDSRGLLIRREVDEVRELLGVELQQDVKKVDAKFLSVRHSGVSVRTASRVEVLQETEQPLYSNSARARHATNSLEQFFDLLCSHKYAEARPPPRRWTDLGVRSAV